VGVTPLLGCPLLPSLELEAAVCLPLRCPHFLTIVSAVSACEARSMPIAPHFNDSNTGTGDQKKPASWPSRCATKRPRS
jgi:hypothetical protein